MYYFFYVLKSQKTGKAYYGITDNLKRRLYQHNHGQNQSTKPDMPWKLVYAEMYQSKQLAEQREKMIKYQGRAVFQLKRRIGFDL